MFDNEAVQKILEFFHTNPIGAFAVVTAAAGIDGLGSYGLSKAISKQRLNKQIKDRERFRGGGMAD